MPVKESTIRFKIDGIQGASSALQQLAREIKAQQTVLERQARVTAQATQGLAEGKLSQQQYDSTMVKVEQRTKVANERIALIQKDVAVAAEGDVFKVKQNMLDRSAALATEQFKNDTDTLKAITTVHMQASKEIATDKQAAIQREGRTTASAYAEDEKRTARKVKVEEQAAKKTAADRAAWKEHEIKQQVALMNKEDTERARVIRRREQSEKRTALTADDARGALSGFGGKMVLAHAGGIAAGDIIGSRHGGQELGSALGGFMFGGPVIGGAVAGLELIGSAVLGVRENTKAAREAAELYNTTLREISNTWGEMVSSLVQRDSFGSRMESEFERATKAAEKGFAEARAIAFENRWGNFSQDLAAGFTGQTPGYAITEAALREMAMRQKRYASLARAEEEKEYPRTVEDRKQRFNAQKELYAAENQMPGALKEKAVLEAQIAADKKDQQIANRVDLAQADAGLSVTKTLAAEAKRNADAARAAAKADNDKMMPDLSQIYEQDATMQAKLEKETKNRARIVEQQNAKNSENDAKYQHMRDELERKRTERVKALGYQTTEATIRAEKTGVAQKLALQNAAFVEEERLNENQTARVKAEIAKRQQAQGDATRRELRESLDTQLASYSREAALRVFGRQQNDAKDSGATQDEMRLLAVGQYLNQIEQDRINLKMVSRNITIAEAELQRMLAADKRSNDPTVRAAIEQEAALKQQIANAEEMTNLRVAGEEAVLQKRFELHQLTVLEFEQQRALLSDRRAQENSDVAEELRKTISAKDAAEVTRDVVRYRMQGMEEALALQVKRHQISQRDADVERMILADRRAQERSPEGERIRQEIIALADARQKLRDTEILQTGQFSTQYTAGMVNFRALNQNRPYGFYRGNQIDPGFSAQFGAGYANFGALSHNTATTNSSTKLLGQIEQWLSQIARTGGLN